MVTNGYNEILARLIIGRKQAGLSQSQVAKMVGVTTSTISDMENNRDNRESLTVSRLLQLVEIYDLSIEWVMTGINPYFDSKEVSKRLGVASKELQSTVELLASLRQNPPEN